MIFSFHFLFVFVGHIFLSFYFACLAPFICIMLLHFFFLLCQLPTLLFFLHRLFLLGARISPFNQLLQSAFQCCFVSPNSSSTHHPPKTHHVAPFFILLVVVSITFICIIGIASAPSLFLWLLAAAFLWSSISILLPSLNQPQVFFFNSSFHHFFSFAYLP